MRFKWRKIKNGGYTCYPLYPNLNIWYFIAENASYWCSFDIEGNGQLNDKTWNGRMSIGKKECKEHFKNND